MDREIFSYTPSDLLNIPARPVNSHKGTFGRVLVIGGSPCMSGAAFFSAKAAYRTGAGLVHVMTHEANRIILQTTLPEAILTTYTDEDLNEKSLAEAIAKATAVVIGVGLGRSDRAKELVDFTFTHSTAPIIADADALNIISENMDVLNSAKAPVIITPHLLEMSRLCSKSVGWVINNKTDCAAEFAEKHSVVCVLKDHETVVAAPKKQQIYLNKSGNSGMATGGSGDVLTGIIAGLIAQGKNPYDSATLGVYVHGLAGDHAAKELGEYSVMASDIADSISAVLKSICK